MRTVQAKWKQQLAEKQEEEAMANRLAQNADSMFAIGTYAARAQESQEPLCPAFLNFFDALP
jgi:hypothetical protein